jgi:hypothetical protein
MKANELIIIEIPHQTSPRVYTYYESELIEDAQRLADPDESIDTLEQAVDCLLRNLYRFGDLYRVIVIKNQDDYNSAVEGDPGRGDGGHQYAKYIGALREVGRELGYEAE